MAIPWTSTFSVSLMPRAPLIPLARIVRTHGLKGEVSVSMMQEFPFDLPVGLEVWLVPPPAAGRSTLIDSVRRGPKGPLVKLAGIDTIEHAATLRGLTITASAADLPSQVAEEPFDPVGMTVVDESRGEIGVISDVIVTGANDVWVVNGGPWGQVLVPVIDDVIINVDQVAHRVSVTLLDGLIDGQE